MFYLIFFIIATALNVILQTIKSLLTIKAGKTVAAFMNALAYGYYTYIIILTTNDNISTFAKMIITASCNFLGVWIVKYFEEKLKKEKLWKIEFTVKKDNKIIVIQKLHNDNISFNYIDNVGEYTIFNCFAATKEETRKINDIIKMTNGKYFISETKNF